MPDIARVTVLKILGVTFTECATCSRAVTTFRSCAQMLYVVAFIQPAGHKTK